MRLFAKIFASNFVRPHVLMLKMAVVFILTVAPLSAQTASILNQTPTGVADKLKLNRAIKPCENFYEFANGGWLARAVIPSDRSTWGVDDELDERNLKRLKDILETAAKGKNTPGSNAQKIGDFYRTAMDSATIEREGLKPLQGELDRLNNMHSPRELEACIGRLHRLGVGVVFEPFAGEDEKNAAQVILQFNQNGLGLPDRDYYFNQGVKAEDIRREYMLHVARVFHLLGEDSVKAMRSAVTVMEMETRLAKASMTLVQQRNPKATYNKMTLDSLARFAPEFSWHEYIAAFGGKAQLLSAKTLSDGINIRQPDFIREVARMKDSVSIDVWRTYFRWHLVNEFANNLSSAFVNEHFSFYGKILRGRQSLPVRWKRVINEVDGFLGEALGQVYVEKYFPPKAKARMKELVGNIVEVLRERIQTLEWMSDSTKKQALKKLSTMGLKIGYPDKWRNYAALNIQSKNYLQNVMAAEMFEIERQLKKVGQPTDKSEWLMTPPTINAYYNPTTNDINFPAGILQPPYFDMNADDAVNYGAIGGVIGHEITHGFDDQGRQYDDKGNLRDWWTEQDAKNYNERAALVVKQYSEYVPIDTLHLNGELTLGENIADIGGLKIAYLALQKSFKGVKPKPIDGFTAEQRFFLVYAESWRLKMNAEMLRLRIATDVHSPALYRVLGPLSIMPEFYEAFGCTPNDTMFRSDEKRAKIW